MAQKSETQLQPKTYTFDAAGKTLGRLSARVALILQDKNTPAFLYHQKRSKKVVIYHTDDIRVTGVNKPTQKIYYRHSGFPGGIKGISLKHQMEKDSTVVMRKAIKGMLPKNKLQKRLMASITLYKGELPTNK